MSSLAVPRKLWENPAPEKTIIDRFRRELATESGQQLKNFDDLYQYSIDHCVHFNDFLLRFSGMIYEGKASKIVDESARMDSIPTWFEGIRINYAENMLLSRNGNAGKEDDKIAITEVNETGLKSTKRWTWGQLRKRTGHLVQALKAHGIQQGDRIAAVACTNLQTLVVCLATSAVGAIFSSSSTDMGAQGILNRVVQVEPKLIFMDDTAIYNGKKVDLRDKVKGVLEGMQSVKGFEGIVTMPHVSSSSQDISHLQNVQTLSDFLSKAKGDALEFVRVPFGAPFLIVYSSGTTGTPKCIAHSVGGGLLSAWKEGALNQDTTPSSVTLQYTTTSWIMYFSQISALMFGSKVILFDGSPFLPEPTILLKLVEQEGVTFFGISPRYLQELQKAKLQPKRIVDLKSLKIVCSTGMVLPDSLFEWFYDEGFPPEVRLNNMSGGTDIAGCFAIGNPITPVYVGGCSGLCLGMRVEVYDSEVEGSHVKGRPVKDGVPGELVVTSAFPNQPVTFWGKDGAERYHSAYFARFDNVWTHGDFVMLHPVTKQLLFLGRSDGVLNPSGVRFGSAEIYKVLETDFTAEVSDSVCVGQRRPTDKDERVFLFLLLRPGVKFSDDLVSRVKQAIRRHLSARHVPAFIFPTPEIPTTVNMKKVELPVKQIISGAQIKPSGMLANPKSLDYFYQFAKVEKLGSLRSKL